MECIDTHNSCPLPLCRPPGFCESNKLLWRDLRTTRLKCLNMTINLLWTIINIIVSRTLWLTRQCGENLFVWRNVDNMFLHGFSLPTRLFAWIEFNTHVQATVDPQLITVHTSCVEPLHVVFGCIWHTCRTYIWHPPIQGIDVEGRPSAFLSGQFQIITASTCHPSWRPYPQQVTSSK